MTDKHSARHVEDYTVTCTANGPRGDMTCVFVPEVPPTGAEQPPPQAYGVPYTFPAHCAMLGKEVVCSMSVPSEW